ncbi:MAG TPA: hypothetical protein VLC46_11365 [Thermoanaerobaculia bacterium]|jgi:hypothetical protein|nr:hypothetical protein [Thermoanaerobaculia bacterium]
MKLALFIVAALAIPLIALRGRSLRRCFECELGAVLVVAGLAALGRVLRIDVDPYLALVAAGAIIIAIPLGFLAFADDVRWSANRAFAIAAIGYAVMIPMQLRTPIDGDEPYYLLMTESLVRDHDLDLTNQYRGLAHSDTGRPDLVPQPGDPRGPHGEQYSRHEPFLPILMMPGYALGGVPGAIAIIALFGALLMRSTVRFFEDEGIADSTTRALFPLIAFGPPIVFYATRIWPEVPAAFCFLEAVRGVRQRRPPRWIAATFGLVLLKIRFGLIAIVLLARVLRTRRQAVIAGALVTVPLLVAWLISGNAMNTHSLRELMPSGPIFYWLGLFGLVLDGAAGLLFQAPLYALAVVALPRWREMPGGFRLGMSASLLYIVYLIPRSEWHGGWSPPLRYIVVLMPILALGAAALWDRAGAGVRSVITAWTLMLVVHGSAFPWRLFHLATGENFIGESLSATWHSDFSRLMPSFIRPNLAAIVGSGALVGVLVTIGGLAVARYRGLGAFGPHPAQPRDHETARPWRGRPLKMTVAPLVFALLLFAAFTYGRQPGDRVEFEDVHVTHNGGEQFPTEWTVSRFLYQGGWIVHAGDKLSFLARSGSSTVRYQSQTGATIELGANAFVLPPTGAVYGFAHVNILASGRTELHCLDGTANLDWMQHD